MGRERAVRDHWQGAFSQQQIIAWTHFVGVASAFLTLLLGQLLLGLCLDRAPPSQFLTPVWEFKENLAPSHPSNLGTLCQGQSTNKYIYKWELVGMV